MSILKQLFRKKYALILCLTCFTLSSYGSGDSIKNVDVLPKQEIMQTLDSALDMLKNYTPDQDTKGLAKFYIEATEQLVAQYPDEEEGAYYLDVAGLIYIQILDEPNKGIETYNFLILHYPDFDKMEEVLYIKAVTLDLDLREKEKAIETYQSLLDQFPDTKFRTDVETRIQKIDLSKEDIIEGK